MGRILTWDCDPRLGSVNLSQPTWIPRNYVSSHALLLISPSLISTHTYFIYQGKRWTIITRRCSCRSSPGRTAAVNAVNRSQVSAPNTHANKCRFSAARNHVKHALPSTKSATTFRTKISLIASGRAPKHRSSWKIWASKIKRWPQFKKR